MENNVNGDDFMRLYNIYYTCKAVLSGLRSMREVRNDNGSRRLKNWGICRRALESLFDFEFIKDDARNVYGALSSIDRESNEPVIGNTTYANFSAYYKKVVNKVEAVVDLYESMKDGISQPGIDIKIPACSELRQYIELLRDLDFILEQCPYLKNEDEELRYGGTDVGSDWITFALITSGAVSGTFVILNNLAALVSKAIALKSNKKVLDMQEEMLKTMQTKNEITSETVDTFKRLKELTYKKYVDELQGELGEVADGEEEGKVAKSLEKLANLIDKGVEIYSSIETPKEIKVLFPFEDKQEALPDSLMKFLEDKASEESE